MSKQSGQITVEMVLIITVLLGTFLFVRKNLFQDGEFLSNLVGGPWDYVSGMIESGRFGKPDNVRTQHPGRGDRHSSLKGVPE